MGKVKKTGAKGKYQHWLTDEGLIKLEGWARDGLTNEQIAQNIGINPDTLYTWMNKFPEISEALKRGKEVVDRQVENALLKRALGYQFTEQKLVSVEMSNEEYYEKQQFEKQQYKLSHPEATQEEINAHMLSIPKYKMVVVEEKVKEVAPDTTAQIFWLKNRKPETWRDKQQIEHSGAIETTNPLSQLSVEELKELIRK